MTVTTNRTGYAQGSAQTAGGTLVPCPEGRYSGTGYSPCLDAPAGSFVDTTGATSATVCPMGYFQPSSGASECIPAEVGYIVPQAGAAAQSACQPGTYQNQAAQSACLNADPGRYVGSEHQSSQTPCAPGIYQPNAQATQCILATPNFFVDVSGATSKVACPTGFVSAAGASSCVNSASISAGVSNLPQFNQATKVAAPGETVLLTGKNLAGISGLLIHNLPIAFLAGSGSISFTVPTSLETGKHDLVVISDTGRLKISGYLVIQGEPLTQIASSPSGWTKRISDSAAKLYASNLIGAGKVQFFFNDKEITWVRAVDASDPKLRSANGASYLVRTVALVSGMKNVLEIYVDGVRVKRVAYTG